VYGLIVGLIYAAVDRLWVGFFTESDPINREPEGPGSRVLYSLRWGAVASLVGRLLFSLVMLTTGVLPTVANLVGGSFTWTTAAAGAVKWQARGGAAYGARD
jgi:hypothetical protein